MWAKSADDILEAVAVYCQRITDAGTLACRLAWPEQIAKCGRSLVR
jgi:hypothetical protein